MPKMIVKNARNNLCMFKANLQIEKKALKRTLTGVLDQCAQTYRIARALTA